jgi:hypothetical protein
MATPFKDGLTGGTDVFSNFGIYIEFFHIASGQSLKFKAFLTNYTETYDVSFTPVEVYGRMDPIEIYKGTKRNLNLGWDVIAETEIEAYTNLQKVQKYIQMMYPRYNDYKYGNQNKSYTVSVVGAPPLVKVKFVNLIANSQKSRFYKVEEETDNRVVGNFGPGAKNTLKELYLKEYNPENKRVSRLAEFSYRHGPARTHGLLAAPGSLDVNMNLIEDGSLINPINCGVAVLPTRISLNSQFTILHEHDLGISDKFNVSQDKKGKGRSKIITKSTGRDRKSFKHFPYGAVVNPVKRKS